MTEGKFTLRDSDGQDLIRVWRKDDSVALAASTAAEEAVSMDPAEARDLAAALLQYVSEGGIRHLVASQPGPVTGEWVNVGEVTASNQQILIIAAHSYRPSPDLPVPEGWTDWSDILAYKVMHRQRDPHARHDQLHAEMLAPGYEGSVHQMPGHRSEEAILVSTASPHAVAIAEGRPCTDDPAWPGYCELRIRLHDHGDPGVMTGLYDDSDAE